MSAPALRVYMVYNGYNLPAASCGRCRSLSGLAVNPESESGADPSSRFDAEAGYGMSLLGDRFTGTPNGGFGLLEAAREYRMGWRLTSDMRGDPGFEVSLDATRCESSTTTGRLNTG